jgi:hypothetical protein
MTNSLAMGTSSASRYAVLNIFADYSSKSDINYDLYLGDSLICKIKNSFKSSIAIKKEGSFSIWAKNENRSETLIALKFGQTYYIKCSVIDDSLKTDPKIEIVEPNIGIQEFDLFKNP